jgi:hypothetical protein
MMITITYNAVMFWSKVTDLWVCLKNLFDSAVSSNTANESTLNPKIAAIQVVCENPSEFETVAQGKIFDENLVRLSP